MKRYFRLAPGEQNDARRKLFPTRTLVLMVLALLAFVWMYTQTHRAKPQSESVPVEIVSPPTGESR